MKAMILLGWRKKERIQHVTLHSKFVLPTNFLQILEAHSLMQLKIIIKLLFWNNIITEINLLHVIYFFYSLQNRKMAIKKAVLFLFLFMSLVELEGR